jgi:CMP-N-acetylneuraminic acid synthetase
MTIPGIILARGGSKRLPGKNIKPICGRPMIYWALDALAGFERVIVGTDSDKIAGVVREYSKDITIYDREPVGDTDRMEDELILMGQEYGFDQFILLQATSPLVTSRDVAGAMELYGYGDYDSIVSGVNQWRRRWYPAEHYCERNKHKLCVINGAIFISSITTINQYDTLVGSNCGFYEMPLDTYYDIDTQEEFEICEMLLRRRIGKG